jgi:hypothetical protein
MLSPVHYTPAFPNCWFMKFCASSMKLYITYTFSGHIFFRSGVASRQSTDSRGEMREDTTNLHVEYVINLPYVNLPVIIESEVTYHVLFIRILLWIFLQKDFPDISNGVHFKVRWLYVVLMISRKNLMFKHSEVGKAIFCSMRMNSGCNRTT